MSGNKIITTERARLIFFFSLLLVSMGILFTIPRLAVPFALSYVMYLILDPLIPALMKIGVRRNFAVAYIFITLLFIVSIPIMKLVPYLSDDAQNIQQYIPRVEEYIKSQYFGFSEFVLDKTGMQLGDQYLVNAIEYSKKASAGFLLHLPDLLGSFIEWLFVVPLFLFFLMQDGRSFKRFVLELTPNSIFERFYSISSMFNKKLGDYIFAKIVEAGIVQFMITVGLLALDVRFSILLGLIAGLTNIIPYLGPVLGMLPAIAFGMVEYGPSTTLWGIIIVYGVANILDIALIFPVLVSKIVDLHPIVVVIAVILGSQYLGTVGMVISIPVAVAIKLVLGQICRELYSTSE